MLVNQLDSLSYIYDSSECSYTLCFLSLLTLPWTHGHTLRWKKMSSFFSDKLKSDENYISCSIYMKQMRWISASPIRRLYQWNIAGNDENCGQNVKSIKCIYKSKGRKRKELNLEMEVKIRNGKLRKIEKILGRRSSGNMSKFRFFTSWAVYEFVLANCYNK